MITNTENCSDETFVYCASFLYLLSHSENEFYKYPLLCVSHSSYLFFSDTPSQRVQFILGTEEDEEHAAHELFTELDEICAKDGKDAEWKETARYAHVLQHDIQCQKCNSGVLALLTAKYDHSCAKRSCIFMQRTNLLCKKILICVKYYLENV